MSAPNPLPSFLYKILPSTVAMPSLLAPDAVVPTTALDDEDGFIHLSTSVQVPYVLSRFFANDGLVTLVKIDYEQLSQQRDLRWEPAGKSIFAHVYSGHILGAVVADTRDVKREESWEATTRELEEVGWLV